MATFSALYVFALRYRVSEYLGEQRWLLAPIESQFILR